MELRTAKHKAEQTLELSSSAESSAAVWQAILQASATLLNAATEARWSDLSVLAGEREELIRAYFLQPVSVDDALLIRDKIKQLLAIDDQVLGLARKEQRNLSPALKSFAKNKQAIDRYQQVGR